MGKIVVGLDVGSSYVRAALGEVFGKNDIKIIEVVQEQSDGLKNGIIVNSEQVVDSIKNCIRTLVETAGYEISSCVAALGGTQVGSIASTGIYPLSHHSEKERAVTKDDIQKVLRVADSVQFPMDRELLHLIPRSYKTDNEDNLKNPLGHLGMRLEADVYMVTVSKNSVENLKRCVKGAELQLDRIMLNSLSAMYAVMEVDERLMGSVLIDMGESTTDVIVVKDDAPYCTASIPTGGGYITNAIATAKNIPYAVAEKIKTNYGCCWSDLLAEDTEIIISGPGTTNPKKFYQSEICGIIETKMREIFLAVFHAIENSVKSELSGNIILTGGGSLMQGAVQLAKDVFNTRSVRLGVPRDFGGVQEKYRKADFATCVGLVASSGDDTFSVQEEETDDSKGVLSKAFKFIKECF